jgi:hypothetical protein
MSLLKKSHPEAQENSLAKRPEVVLHQNEGKAQRIPRSINHMTYQTKIKKP